MRFIFFNFALVKSQGNIQGIREQPLQQIEVSAGETARVEKDGKKKQILAERSKLERVRVHKERWKGKSEERAREMVESWSVITRPSHTFLSNWADD